MSRLDLECADIKLERREIVEIIYYLFYPHLRLAQELITENTIDQTEFIQALFICIHKYEFRADFSPYFIARNDVVNFSDYKPYKAEINKKLKNQKIYHQIPDFFKYFIFGNLMNASKIVNSYSGLVSQLMQVMSIEENSRKRLDEYDYKTISIWYNRLFNKDHAYFFEIAGEDKHLEQQLLDMYYGFSLIGYLYDKKIDAQSNFIDACGYLRLFGLSSGITKILDEMIKLYYEEDGITYNEYDFIKDETQKFAKNLLEIFYQLMLGFIEFVYHLGTYENRKEYFLEAPDKKPVYNSIDSVDFSEPWKHVLLDVCDDADWSENIMLISEAYEEDFDLDLDVFYLFQETNIPFTNILDLSEDIDNDDKENE